jgi:hypothetical protein
VNGWVASERQERALVYSSTVMGRWPRSARCVALVPELLIDSARGRQSGVAG